MNDSTPENSNPPQPPMAPPPDPAESAAAKHHRRRNGNVAQLPKDIRDRISQMLLDGVTYAGIIEKLGDAGKGLVPDHIRSWNNDGGHDEWLNQQQRTEDLKATREGALSLLKQKAGATVQDAGRTIAAAQMYELLLSFDPRSFSAALAEKPELYFKLINALARLSEGEAVCSRLRAQGSLIESQLDAAHTGEPGKAPAVISSEQLKQIVSLIKLL